MSRIVNPFSSRSTTTHYGAARTGAGKALRRTTVVYAAALLAGMAAQSLLSAALDGVLAASGAAFAGAPIAALAAAAVQGLVAGIGGVLFCRIGSTPDNPRGRGWSAWISGIVGGAVVGAAAVASVASATARGGSGPPDFVPAVFAPAVVMICGAVVGAIVCATVGGGLATMGMAVGTELAEGYGRQSGARLAGGRRFRAGAKYAAGPGIVAGAIAGAVAFDLHALAGSSVYWQIFVQLFGAVAALIGGAILFAVLESLFTDPKRFFGCLGQLIFWLALLIGAIILIGKCSSGSSSGPSGVPFRPPAF